MSDYMRVCDALELCKLRIKEDGISAPKAITEFRSLTGMSLTACGHMGAIAALNNYYREQIK